MSASPEPVSPEAFAAPERILGEDGGRAYRRFLAWTVGDGFAMAVIEVRSPAQRRELLAWTKAETPGTQVALMDQASGKPLRPFLEAACPEPGGAGVLVLARLEDAPERIKLFARINIQRDELARDFPVPWVVLIHPAAALEMHQHAPDFSDFAGLWLNEEREEGAAQLEAFEPLGMELLSMAAPVMRSGSGDGDSALLGRAEEAFALSRYDEVVDLLAQYDMRHPDAHGPGRIRLDGLLLRRRGRLTEALSRFEEAQKLCDPVTDRLAYAAILLDIALIRAQQGDVDAALALHHEALQIYEELGDRGAWAAALSDIARLRADKGEVDAALARQQEALQIHEELGDQHSRAMALGDVARLLREKGEVDAALALHLEELQVYEDMGNRHARAIALGDIARLRDQKGEVDEALALQREALQIYEELDEPEGIAGAHWSLGRLAFRQGDGKSAFEHLSKAYDISNKIGRLDAICIIGIDLARLLLKEGRKAGAIPILARSRDGFLRLGRAGDAQQTQKLLDAATDDA